VIRYRKGPCPDELAAHAATPGADWSGFKDKQAVRDALVRDQGRLCAYCQRAIKPAPATAMKIDHWIPRSDKDEGPANELRWENLVGACTGETSFAEELNRHCDTRRGDEPVQGQRLHLHPVEGQGPDPRQGLRYQAKGGAYAHPPDSRVDNDITILNLNCAPLKEARRQVLERLEQRLKRVGFTSTHVKRLLDDLDHVGTTPFIEVARDYLRRKLRQVS
jgi:uncharacterized protein (TIGR02646 family)